MSDHVKGTVLSREFACPDCGEYSWRLYPEDEYYLCDKCGYSVTFKIDDAIRARAAEIDKMDAYFKTWR